MRARILALTAVLATVFAVYAYAHSTAAVGRPAPEFTLQDVDGGTVSLQSLRGRVVLLEFWASWCTVCRQDTPALRTFADRYGDRVAVVGVDWREPATATRQWVSAFALTFPNVRDASGTVARKYGLTGVPEAWWIDANGTARLHVTGPADFEELQRQYAQVTHTAPDTAAPAAPAALAGGPGALWLAAGGPSGGIWTRPDAGTAPWTRTGLPGPFQAVAVGGGTILAAGANAGWVASEDGGVTWAKVRSAGSAGDVPTALAADAAHPGAFYAWVGGRLVHAEAWRSGFRPVPAEPPVAGGDAVRALAARGSTLLVATQRAILVSSDGGMHWRTAGLQRTPLGTQEFTTAAGAIEDQVPLVASGGRHWPRRNGPAGGTRWRVRSRPGRGWCRQPAACRTGPCDYGGRRAAGRSGVGHGARRGPLHRRGPVQPVAARYRHLRAGWGPVTRGARRGGLWLLLFAGAVGVVSIVLARSHGARAPVNKPAPAFTLPDVTGRQVALSAFAGQDVALRFGSVTCTVCDSDWDTLTRWQQAAGSTLRIVAIEVGQSPDLVRLRMQGVQTAVPVLVDADGSVAAAYAVSSLPTFAFIDQRGELVAVQPVVNRGAIWPDTTWQFYVGLLRGADARLGRT